MSLQPVLPLWLLAAVATVIVVARVAVWRRIPAQARTGAVLWRWGGLTAAALLLVLAAARPVIETDEQTATRVAGDQAPNIFLLVDRSPDMQVRDIGDLTRMALARTDISALIDRYPDARFAVIAFAARPALDWPLSADTWSLRPLIAGLQPYGSDPLDSSQTNVGAAGNVLRYQLLGAGQQYPRAKNLVFYLGAGAPDSEVAPRRFELPAGSVDGGAVLGYGRQSDGPALRAVAEQIGVPFAARADAGPLSTVLPAEAHESTPGPTVGAAPDRIEMYWALASVAALLILIELYRVLRDLRRTRFASVDVRR